MTAPAPWTRRVTAWALDGHVYHTVCPPTGTLVPMILAEPGWLVFATLRDDTDRADLYTRVVPDHGMNALPDAVLTEIADTLIGSWTGWPGWTATRIWRQALEEWQGVDGKALTHGQDILTLAPDRATTAVFALLAERHAHDKDKGERWRRALTERPLDVIRREAAAPDEADKERAAGDWQAMASIFKGMQH